MWNSIKNTYNELPASWWEYQELFNSVKGYVLVLFLLIIIILVIKNYRDNKKLRKALGNIPQLKVNQELRDKVDDNKQKVFNLEIRNKETEEEIKQIKNKLKDAYRTETVEYNPYQDAGVGGKQSFSTAFINKNGDGIILTSLYARDRTRLLVKNITNFTSEKELAPEEKELLKKFKK